MKTKETGKKIDYLSGIVAFFVIAILAGMLLVYQDYYFNILEIKYYYYCLCAVGMIALAGGYLLISGRFREIWRGMKGKKLLEIFSFSDLAVLAFCLVAVISALLSPFKWEAFWGNECRYTGTFLILLYTATYFIITRFYRVREWHLVIFLFAGILMCLFGITDFFNMDILGFKVYMRDTQRHMFTSTIGNINTYTSCVAMIMAAAGTLYGAAKDVKREIGYGLCTVIAFFALFMGQSDNAYLSLAAFFGFLPLYLFRSKRGIRRYATLLAAVFSVIKCISWILIEYSDTVIPLHGIFDVVSGFGKMNELLALLWGAVVILWIWELVFAKKKPQAPKALIWLWWGVIAAVFAAVVYALYDANIAGNVEKYGGLSKYLVINDDWGTHRWYIWRIAIENYMDFPLAQKIFGHGPDTFGLVTYFNNLEDMTGRYGEIFDSAHNEYIQYLVTMGPTGLLAYLAFHVTAFWNIVRKRIENPIFMAILFAVLCYAAQAVVNINQPIATPVMWTLLSIGCVKNDRA